MTAGKYMLIFLVFFFMLKVLPGQSVQCSAFVDTTDGTKLAKNLDWILGNGMVIYNPASEEKGSITCPDKGRIWTSKYSSVTFNHLGNNMPLGGMNDAGLVVEELSTWPSGYPVKKQNCLNELEWIQYQLDLFNSVEEIIENIETAGIEKFIFGLHYIVADKEGNSAVIEFINDKPKIYTGPDLPVPAVTNNNYEELLKYYGLSADGKFEIHNVENSQDRFVKLAHIININGNNNSGMNCNDMLSILDSVRVRETKWSIVYDIERQQIHFKTDNSETIRIVSFEELARAGEKVYARFYSADALQFRKLRAEDDMNHLMELKTDILNLDPEDDSGIAAKIDILIKGQDGH